MAEPIRCPECDCTTWETTEGFTGTDLIGTNTETNDWSRSGLKYNADGGDEWWCTEHQHDATPEINDQLFERYSEALPCPTTPRPSP